MTGGARDRLWPGRAASSPALHHALFGVVPVVVTGWLLLHVFSDGFAAVDFRQDFWTAAWRVLHGQDPYAWSRAQIAAGESFPYPALAAVLFAPFALIPAAPSAVLFTALCLLAAVGTLRLMSVRDWRLYGLVLLWSPVVIAWQTANLSLLLAFGLAALWRFRDRPRVAGLIVALLISVKPIMLPLGLWLVATRRLRASAWAVAAGLVVNAAAWAVVGFSEIGRWLHLLSEQTDILYRKGYGVIALCADLGGSRGTGLIIELGLSAVLALAIAWLAWQRARVTPFSLAVLLVPVVSPQVDSHYFVLLLVPLLIAHPRLHWTWLAPLVLWVCPAADASLWQAVVWWAVVLAIGVDLLRPPPRARVAAPPWGAQPVRTATVR